MNPEPASSHDTARFAGRAPAAAWVLVGLALVTVAVGIGVRGFTGPYLVLDLPGLASLLDLATSFLLAAGVVMRAERWQMPGGRVQLVVVLLTLRGIIVVAREAWLQWWFGVSSGPSDLELTLLSWSGVVMSVAFIAALVVLAVALWGSGRRDMSAGRVGAVLGIGLLGIALAASAITGAFRIQPPTADDALILWLWQGGFALQAGAIAFLAIGAARRIPLRHQLPEVLIAVGAALVLASTAWSQWFNLLTGLDVPQEWWALTITLPRLAAIIGILAVAAGFASARLFPLPDRPV